jgi:hypothetical protein
MAKITAIIPFDGFIEVVYEGVFYKGFPNRNAFIEQIVAVCQEHQCFKVLEDCYDVDYEPSSDVLAEHEFAIYVSQPRFRRIQWAVLLPKNTLSTKAHIENAAVNRGVKLRTFLDREKAVRWLLDD